METLEIFFRILLAFLCGGVIGIEREVNEKTGNDSRGEKTAIVGLRSFSLIGALGAIVGFLAVSLGGLALLIAGAFFLLMLIYYILDSQATKDPGITTELAMIYSFVLGLLLSLSSFPIQLTLAITVVLMLLLSQKTKIKSVMQGIKKEEIGAFISYAIIAVVILPFLPNTTYALADIPGLKDFLGNFSLNIDKILTIELLNPFKLWLIVALITGVDMVGYVLEKTIGKKKGWVLASIAGGFISSTATTQSLAQQSTTSKRVHHLLAAALVANLVSFFQIAILIAPVNPVFLVKIIPVIFGIVIVALLLIGFFLRSKEKSEDSTAVEKISEQKDIFTIGPALKFATLFLVIGIATKIALVFFGSGGFLITTAIGALAGLDAVMINTAQLAGKTVDFQLALTAFVLANAVNLVGKTVYSFLQGKQEFAVKFGISMILLISSSLLMIILI